MAHVPQRIIRAANRRAQRRLHELHQAIVGERPTSRRERVYRDAELRLDSLRAEYAEGDLRADWGNR